MKTFLKKLAAVGLGLGISLAGVNTAFAANLTWTADQTIDLSAPDINFVILNGSKAESLVVGAGSIQVVVADGDTFTLTSADRELNVTGATTAEIDNDARVHQPMQAVAQQKVRIVISATASPPEGIGNRSGYP